MITKNVQVGELDTLKYLLFRFQSFLLLYSRCSVIFHRFTVSIGQVLLFIEHYKQEKTTIREDILRCGE
jgi:hypothetical protein